MPAYAVLIMCPHFCGGPLANVCLFSGPDSAFIGIIKWKGYHCGRDAFLLAIKFANLNAGARRTVLDGHSAQGDIFLQNGRANSAGDGPSLIAPYVDTIAIGCSFLPGQFQANQNPLRVGLAFYQCLLADKVIVLGFQWYREWDPCFIRISLIAEFVTSKDEPRFNAQHVQRFQAEWNDVERFSGLPDGVPDTGPVIGMAKHFIAKFPGVACARNNDRYAIGVANSGDGKAKPAKLFHGRLVRPGPDDLAKQCAAFRSLDL